ncbi:MAG: hypothetical protein WC967_13540 [Balneolaceae bacterium]
MKRTDEITYDLDDGEMVKIGQWIGVKIDQVMVLATYRYHSEGQEVELFEYKPYVCITSHGKVELKIPVHLQENLSNLLDETKLIEFIVNKIDYDKVQAELNGYSNSINDYFRLGL